MTISINKLVLRIFLILLLAIFIFSGINKILNFNSTSNLIASQIPFTKNFSNIITILVILTIIILPCLIIYNPLNSIITQLSTIALVIFMILVIIFFHNPLTMKDQLINFMTRLSMIGGLLLILFISQ